MDEHRTVARRHVPEAPVVVLAGLLAGVGVAIHAFGVAGLERRFDPPVELPFVVLLVLFVLAEITIVHITRDRDSHSLSFSDVALVIGLALAPPTHVVAAWILAGFVVVILVRRQPLRKVIFNGSLFVCLAPLATVTYHALLGDALPIEPRGWAAAIATVALSTAVGAVSVTAVITFTDRWPGWALVGRTQLYGVIGTAASATVGLIAVVLLWSDPWSAVLLAGLAMIVAGVYRAYVNLSERHRSLESLHNFTDATHTRSTTTESLTRVQDLLNADEVYLVASFGDGIGFTHHLRGDTAIEKVVAAELADAVTDRVLAGSGAHTLSARGPLPEGVRADPRGGVVAPIRLDGVTSGALVVTTPRSETGTFDAESVQLLDTAAAHISVTMENEQLIARLTDEAAQRAHEALHDPLTGLANLTNLVQEVDGRLSAGRREPLTLLLFGLDGAKEIADTLGRSTAHAMTSELVDRLTAVASTALFLARVSDDDFVLVFDAGVEETDPMARRLLECLDAPFVIQGASLVVNGHVGMACFPGDGEDAATLIQRADIAAAAAKVHGVGIERYTPERDPYDPTRLGIAADLRSAVTGGQFDVFFQPQVEFSTGRVASAEALVRWQHPTRGALRPEQFIPAAETTNMIGPLTLNVIRTSLEQVKIWRERGHDMSVAVNLSVKNLTDRNLAFDVGALIEEVGVRPADLILELTESSVMTDNERSMQVIGSLHELGVSLSIDDFGTGYSSLTQLRRLPVTEMKIDKSFVSTMTVNEADAAIVTSILRLAESLGLRAVAEGVENPDTYELLAERGCDLAQGYFISRPLPAHLFDEWLSRREPDVADDSSVISIELR